MVILNTTVLWIRELRTIHFKSRGDVLHADVHLSRHYSVLSYHTSLQCSIIVLYHTALVKYCMLCWFRWQLDFAIFAGVYISRFSRNWSAVFVSLWWISWDLNDTKLKRCTVLLSTGGDQPRYLNSTKLKQCTWKYWKRPTMIKKYEMCYIQLLFICI